MTPLSETQQRSQLGRFLSRHQIDSYEALVDKAAREPEWFWRAVMEFHELHFFRPFDQLVDVSKGPEWAKWCLGGTTNIAYNCLERTLEAGCGDKQAITWEAETGEQRSFTYTELRSLVARAADGLTAMGVQQGDVVGLYMPQVPETVAAFLAIIRMGAIALPLFSGFGPQAVADRLGDANAKVVITADYTYRRAKKINMLEVIEEAAPSIPSLQQIVVVERDPASDSDCKHLTWEKLLQGQSGGPAKELPAETPAMIVYTSGTTGKPKGTVHSHCGFMTKVALDFGLVLDLQQQDRLFWMSDMGWLTGPILSVAAPLVGATLVLAEGVPDYPEPGRLWRLAQDHRASFLGVAPTMIRALMQQPLENITSYDLSSLRVTASTGEPWNPEAWIWFRKHVGKDQIPLLNYAGGTEIGGGIVAGTVLHDNLKPCAFAGPIPGMGAKVVNESGQEIARGEVGELALTAPSIGLTRSLWNDDERYLESYWSTIPGLWIHGDFASIDADGQWFIHGRSDDTIKIAGKRTGPAEVEAAVLATEKVLEAAAVGIPDKIKGAAVVCACVLRNGVSPSADLVAELKSAVVASQGSSFRPKAILFVKDLPRTRTLKIMRRVVRAELLGEKSGDLSGLVNPEAVEELREQGKALRA